MAASRLAARCLAGTRSFALLTILGSAACTAAAGSGAEQTGEEDYTVRPTSGSATITVHGAGARTDVKVFAQKQGGPKLQLVPETAKPVSPGTYCLWTSVLDPRDGEVETQHMCDVEVAAASALDYTLGQVTFARSCSDLLLSVDLPTYQETSTRAGVLLGRQTAAVPHAAGTFGYALDYLTTTSAWGSGAGGSSSVLLDKVEGSVAEAGTASVDLCDVSGRAKLRLLPPPQRELPDYPGNGYTLNIRSNGRAETRKILTAPSFAKPVLVFAAPPANADATYVLDVGSKDARLSVPLAPPSQPMKEIQLGRLDVADVEVTKPDGTKVMVAGTFRVTSAARDVYFDRLPTGHGLDLFPGTYTVEVTYVHPVDGAPMKDTHTVTLP